MIQRPSRVVAAALVALSCLAAACGDGESRPSDEPVTGSTSLALITHLSTTVGCPWVGRAITGSTPAWFLEPRSSQPGLDFLGTDLGGYFHHLGVDYVMFGDATRSVWLRNDDAYAQMTDRSPCPKLRFVTEVGPTGLLTAAAPRVRLRDPVTSRLYDWPLGANETSTGISDGRDAFTISAVHKRCTVDSECGTRGDTCCPAGSVDCEPGVCTARVADGGPFSRSAFLISKFDREPRTSPDLVIEGTNQLRLWQSIAARAVPRFDPRTPFAGAYHGMPNRPEGAAASQPKLFVWGRPAFGATIQQATYLLYYDLAEPSVTRWQKPMVFSGFDAAGAPIWKWTDPAQLETSVALPVIPAATETIGGAPILLPGLMSVSWVEELGTWLMIYGGRPPGAPDAKHGDKLGTRFAGDATLGLVYRTAPHPWGPWSAPKPLWSAARDGGYAPGGPLWHPITNAAMHTPGEWPDPIVGGEYGPGIMDRLTTVTGSTVTVRWAMSSFDPYRVWMMESRFSR